MSVGQGTCPLVSQMIKKILQNIHKFKFIWYYVTSYQKTFKGVKRNEYAYIDFEQNYATVFA